MGGSLGSKYDKIIFNILRWINDTEGVSKRGVRPYWQVDRDERKRRK